MEKRKSYQIALFVAMMIMINYFGKTVADTYSWPIWLDSVGTVIAAYVCDPFCGAVVGLTGNVIYGFQDPLSFLYGLTSVAIGISVGISAQKKFFESLFGTLTASVIVTLFSVLISAPINLIVNDGFVGNVWGNGVVSFLREMDAHPVVATIVGEFYVDFLDKVITLVILFIMIRLVRLRKKLMKNTAVVPILLVTAGVLLNGSTANASDNNVNNHNIQTIYGSANGLPCGEANDVIQTNDGILWIGTYAGLYRHNGSEFRLMSEYSSVRNVNCLFLDAEGRLWIGTNDNGVSIAINEKIAFVIDAEDGLPANSIRSITMSSEGNYFIGTTSGMIVLTLDGGMEIVKEIPEIVYAHSISANHDNLVATVTNDGELFLLRGTEIINSFHLEAEQEIYTCVAFGEDGSLYAGTSSNHVYCYEVLNDDLKKMGRLSCEDLNNVNRIFFAEDGTTYVCTDTGVGYLDGNLGFHLLNLGEFRNSIDNMAVDYQGNLWFSSSRLGLLKLSPSPFENVYRSAGLQGSVVNAITKWQGNLYVGTDEGLDVIQLEKNKKIENALTAFLNSVRIRCLLADREGGLWICTYRKGLIHVGENGQVTTFDGTDGTFGDWARVAIELSDGTIAASSDVGLGIFEETGIKKLIPYSDGLSQAMILCLVQLSDGRILCGTDGDGISIVRNGEIEGRFKRADGLSSDVILRIVEDPVEKGAYIVTSNGLCYLDAEDRITVLDNFPYYNNYDVWALEDGTLFVLSSGGIYVTNRAELFDASGKPEYELLDSKRGLNVALTANSWDYLEEDGSLYLSCDNGVYRFNVHNYGATRKSYRMKLSSVFLDGEEKELERGEIFYVDREVTKMEIFPEVINYTADEPYVSYYLEGFDNEPTIVPQSSLTSIVYTNVPAGKYKFYFCVLDGKGENVIEQSTYLFEKKHEIYDTSWFRTYMFIVAMLAVAWLTWFIARTQIQRTINYQKRELEFAKDQLRMGNETILAIAKTVDAKDENTSQHSQRVSEYATMIARELGFSAEECENLRKAALLHDIGKIGIPDRVLNKPEPLAEAEYSIMKSHVTRGAEILKDFTLVEHVIDGTLYHHERYDGSGYPQGLKGENIPLYGRIIGIADAFDAMTANRVYRKQLDFKYVLEELSEGSGKQFDPNLTKILLKLIKDGKINVDMLYGEHVDVAGLFDEANRVEKSSRAVGEAGTKVGEDDES